MRPAEDCLFQTRTFDLPIILWCLVCFNWTFQFILRYPLLRLYGLALTEFTYCPPITPAESFHRGHMKVGSSLPPRNVWKSSSPWLTKICMWRVSHGLTCLQTCSLAGGTERHVGRPAGNRLLPVVCHEGCIWYLAPSILRTSYHQAMSNFCHLLL